MAYTKLSYIQSTGTQYIDTGFLADNHTKVEISFYNDLTDNVYFIGGRTTWGTKSFCLYFEWWYKFVYQEYAYSDIDTMGDILAIMEPPSLTINGQVFEGNPATDYTCDYTMYIFSVNNKGSAYKSASMRLYYMKIWDNGSLVRDYIPVLDENNVACLYDKVSGTYYYNAGSGDFIAGEVLEPPTITVNTPSKTKISRIEGYDRSVVTFTSDIDLQAWEARATLPGVTPARGVGLLVESGTTLSANTEATIYVDDEELTNGDGDYTITVYGQSIGGEWSV